MVARARSQANRKVPAVIQNTARTRNPAVTSAPSPPLGRLGPFKSGHSPANLKTSPHLTQRNPSTLTSIQFEGVSTQDFSSAPPSPPPLSEPIICTNHSMPS